MSVDKIEEQSEPFSEITRSIIFSKFLCDKMSFFLINKGVGSVSGVVKIDRSVGKTKKEKNLN